ncbi:hypothetical protein ABE504_17465 [Paenibacillus oryzisoli]|uniref:hypothetical protein n=1 Tax=Paenibacillus oryzisoli TaxID=1850517 RepID=UPI003D26C60C
MLIISTFEHSVEVEEALAVLEKTGLPRHQIMTVMMDNHDERFDKNAKWHPSQKTLAFEAGMAGATGLSVIGISCGFVLPWGPIYIGILSALFGFVLGYTITRVVQSSYFHKVIRKKERLPELAVIIQCPEGSFHDVQRVLWEYSALSVGTLKQ